MRKKKVGMRRKKTGPKTVRNQKNQAAHGSGAEI